MIARLPTLARRLRSDTDGNTVIEFAIVAPVMCLLLLGAFDVSHTLYMRGVLQGVVQKTARDATLDSTDTAVTAATLDDRVRTQVSTLFNNATITITRRFYRTFAEAAAARAESFTDTNSNGRCDANEQYQDENGNSTWDSDGGNAGQGGAKDATLYTVTVSYPRMMPVNKMIGGSDTTKVTGQTILRNQPYADQGTYGPTVVRNCA